MNPKPKYVKAAEWVERIALASFVGFVIQQLVDENATPVSVILGLLVSAIMYTIALSILAKA